MISKKFERNRIIKSLKGFLCVTDQPNFRRHISHFMLPMRRGMNHGFKKTWNLIYLDELFGGQKLTANRAYYVRDGSFE